jgi:hypothetical protein
VYGVDIEKALRVTYCESGFNALAINASSSAAGLWQFLKSTFTTTAERMGHPEWTYEEYVLNAEVNAQMGAWLAAQDGFGHWVCQ